jgi:hypothetical protein
VFNSRLRPALTPGNGSTAPAPPCANPLCGLYEPCPACQAREPLPAPSPLEVARQQWEGLRERHHRLLRSSDRRSWEPPPLPPSDVLRLLAWAFLSPELRPLLLDLLQPLIRAEVRDYLRPELREAVGVLVEQHLGRRTGQGGRR